MRFSVASRLLNLIEAFSDRVVVPVEVDDVVDYLRSYGIKDEIYFFNADINTEILQGSIIHWEYQMQGWTYKVADIYTPKNQPVEDQRLTQTKELLHVLDARIDRVSSLEDVDALIDQMALPPDARTLATASAQAASDRNGLIHALPVLFPMAARKYFLQLLNAGKIDIQGIADQVALPKGVVEFLLGEKWAAFYEEMIAFLRADIPAPDRIFTRDLHGETIEVYSVPLEEDPYIYAKRIEERARQTAKPIHSAIVKTSRYQREFSARELMEYTPWNPIKPSKKPYF